MNIKTKDLDVACFSYLEGYSKTALFWGHIHNCSSVGQMSKWLDDADGTQSNVDGRCFFRRDLVFEIVGIEAVEGSAVGFSMWVHEESDGSTG
jgi:hypothetical protein